jgi:cold shock CspA family protein
LAEFFFYRGQMKDAADLFDFINEKAPESFRKVASRRESAVTALLGRYSGMIDSMKPKFFFIRSGVYPNSIFAHNSTVDPDVMSDLSMGRDINFRIRFNRAGPVALNIKIGRLG